MSTHTTAFRTHTCGALRAEDVDDTENVSLSGHVHQLVDETSFVIRDHYGQTLCVVAEDAIPNVPDLIPKLFKEDIVQVKGTLSLRETPEVDLPTGAVQVNIQEMTMLSSAAAIPESVMNEPLVPIEERLAQRQLYLRREEMQERLAFRSQVAFETREYLINQGFLEIETPHLFWYDVVATDPEPVPVADGRAFALPSGPVVLNQYIKPGQFDRFFQFVRITRQEREDFTPLHAPEYTGLDINMSYIEVEDLCDMVDGLLTHLAKKLLGIDLKAPPRLSHQEAIAKWGTDKPKLKGDDPLKPVWIHSYPFFAPDSDGNIVPDVVVFSRVHPDDLLKIIMEPEKRHEVRSMAFDLVINGMEIASAYVGNHNIELQKILFDNLFQMDTPDLIRLRAPIEAHRFGIPPHGGMNIGFDRLVAVLLGLEAIDEAMFYPKDHRCRDLMLLAPGPVPKDAVADIVADAPEPNFTFEDYLKEIVEM